MSRKQKKYANPFSSIVSGFAKNFDLAIDEKDSQRIRDLILLAESELPNLDASSQAPLHYSLGTAYRDILDIDSHGDIVFCIEKQLYHFRRSIALIEDSKLNAECYKPYVDGLKLSLYTNYANCLDSCGRKIAALEYYYKSLKINPDFGMALGNIGMAYCHYGMLVYDNSHRDYLNHFSYQFLIAAIKNSSDIHENALISFKQTIEMFDSDYAAKVLKPHLEVPQFSYNDLEELEYRNWALQNNLFINPLNDLPVEELCFAADVLHLPNMVLKVGSKPVCHGMFNQLKQEYIYSRFLYYQSLQIPLSPHFADKDTHLINFSDYPQYSIRIEGMKSVFRILYSMLDKVAFLINQYFELGIQERDVTFQSIWRSEKSGKSGYKYKNILNPMDNFALCSIWWISKDFFGLSNFSPNPEAKKISELRHALEHKYVKIYSDIFPARVDGEVDDLAFYISESDLNEYTMQLLKLLREVLINLSLSINIEEKRKKAQKSNCDSIPQIEFMEYEDDWKI